MERGLIRVRADDGSYPYESFELESSEDIFLTLTKTLDGAESPLDVSAASVKVYLRAKVKGATSLGANLEMTKRAGTTLNGDTGKVSVTFRPSTSAFAAGDYCVMGAYVVDTATTDTPTPSGYKETLWRQLWEWKVVGVIDGSGV